jgi:hypothetical protein
MYYNHNKGGKRMKTKLILVGLLAGIFAFNPVYSNPANADEMGSKAPSITVKKGAIDSTDKAQKTRGGGPVEADLGKMMLNDPNTSTPAPPNKGGDKTRGICNLHVDNHTGLRVAISVDNSYVGMVSSWGDAYGYYSEGAHTLIGVVYYSDGSTSTFGPREIYCYGPHTWNLYP